MSSASVPATILLVFSHCSRVRLCTGPPLSMLLLSTDVSLHPHHSLPSGWIEGSTDWISYGQSPIPLRIFETQHWQTAWYSISREQRFEVDDHLSTCFACQQRRFWVVHVKRVTAYFRPWSVWPLVHSQWLFRLCISMPVTDISTRHSLIDILVHAGPIEYFPCTSLPIVTPSSDVMYSFNRCSASPTSCP